MKLLTAKIGMLQENCYVYYDEKTKKGVMIDPGFVDEAVDRGVDENEVDIAAILITHGHFDHIFGMDYYREKYKAPVYVHKIEADYIRDPMLNGTGLYMLKPVVMKEDAVFKNEFSFDSCVLEILHTPGHTPGCVCIYDRENGVLFSGDTLFLESVGRTDFAKSDHNALIDAIKTKLFTLPENVMVYPGHGPSTTIGHEKRHNPFVR